MASRPMTSDETRLKSLIRAVLQEERFLKRDDSEETIENSLHPGIPPPSDDPFTSQWYASLIPCKIREPFKAPETHPSFFQIRDAQHAALFNPNTPSGGCQEADVLYQAIAFLHRALDDILPLIDSHETVDVWKSIKGVSEMLHTRYDLLCALRRSRDDEHVRCLEMYMQPPPGDGAASARVHREICRAVSRKRSREEQKDVEGPPQARAKKNPLEKTLEDDEVKDVTSVKAKQSTKVKSPGTKDTEDERPKDGKPKPRSSPTTKSTPHTSRSKTAGDASKQKRRTPVKSTSIPLVSRTRSSDVTKRLRSSSTPGKKSEATDSKVATPKNKNVSSVKKNTPKKQPTVNPKTAPVKKKVEQEKKVTSLKSAAANKDITPKTTPVKKKVEQEKKVLALKSAAANKDITPKKQRTSSRSVPSTSGTPARQASRDKKPSTIQRVTSGKRVSSAKQVAKSKPLTTSEDMPSVKKSSSRNKIVSANQSNADKTKGKAEGDVQADDKLTPGAKVDNLQEAEDLEIVHVKLSKKEGSSNEEKMISMKNEVPETKSDDRAKPSSRYQMTNFTYVIHGDTNGEMKSSLHEYAGFQWRVVIHPRGDKYKGWMSVYLECRGPRSSETGDAESKKPSSTDQTETENVSSDQGWFIRVKFSVRVLRTDSAVTKAVLQGKDVTIDNDDGLLSASKVSPDGKVAQAGLLSDFVGAISHDFSPLSDQVGFSRLAPASCLNPGMYANNDKNIVLILFMCAE